MIFDKSAKTIQCGGGGCGRKRQSLQQMVPVKADIHIQKNKDGQLPNTQMNQSSKCKT